MISGEPHIIGTVELTPARRIRARFSKPLFAERSFHPVSVPREITARGGSIIFRPRLRLPVELSDLYPADERPVVLGGKLEIEDLGMVLRERDTHPEGYELELEGPPNHPPVAKPHELEWDCPLDATITTPMWKLVAHARSMDQRLQGKVLGVESLEEQAREFVREVISRLVASADSATEIHADDLVKRLEAVRFFVGRSLDLERTLRSSLTLHKKAANRFMGNLTGALVEGVFYMFDAELGEFWDHLGKGNWTRQGVQEALEQSAENVAEGSMKTVREALTKRLDEIGDPEVILDAAEDMSSFNTQLASSLEDLVLTLEQRWAGLREAMGAFPEAGARSASEMREALLASQRAEDTAGQISGLMGRISELRLASAKRLEEALKLTYEREAINEVMRQLDDVAAKAGPARLSALEETMRGLGDPKSKIDAAREVMKNRQLAESVEAMEALMRGLADPSEIADSAGVTLAKRGLGEAKQVIERIHSLREMRQAPALFDELRAIERQMTKPPIETGFKPVTNSDGVLLQQYMMKLEALARSIDATDQQPARMLTLVEAKVGAIRTMFKDPAAELGEQSLPIGAREFAERAKDWDAAYITYVNEDVEGRLNNLLLASQEVADKVAQSEPPPPGPRAVDDSAWHGAAHWLLSKLMALGSAIWSVFEPVIRFISVILTVIAGTYQFIVDQFTRFIVETSRVVSDSYVEQADAEANRLRARLRSEARLDDRFYEAWPESTKSEVEALRVERLVHDARGDHKAYQERKIQRFYAATETFEDRQWRFGAAAMHALCAKALSADILESSHVIDAAAFETGADRQDIGGFARLERVRSGLTEAFAMTDQYDAGKRGFVGNFYDTCVRVVTEGDFQATNYFAYGDDEGLTWHDWDWIVDWISWFLSWGIRIGGIFVALGVTFGTLGAGVLAGGATFAGAMVFADVADQVGAVLKAAIAGLGTVPATARLQTDALLSQMKTFEELFGK